MGEPGQHEALLKAMLSRPNVCCRNWIASQYDHEVQGGSVIKRSWKAAGHARRCRVVRPVLGSQRGSLSPRP